MHGPIVHWRGFFRRGRAAPLIAFSIFLGLLPVGCSLKKQPVHTWQSANRQLVLVREEIQIPLEKIRSGIKETPYVGIRAEAGKGSMLLLVDTGTSLTLLRDSRKRELSLDKLTRAVIDARRERPRQVYQTSSLRIGPLELVNETVAFLSDEEMDSLTAHSGGQIDGILGAGLLSRGEIEFRGPENAMAIRPFGQSRIRSDDSSLPLIFIPDSNAYAVHLTAEGLGGCRLLFDTGTNVDLILDSPRPVGRRVMDTPQIGTWTCNSVHGSQEMRVYHLPVSISGPGIVFPSGSRVCVDSDRNNPLDGVIGVPIVWKTPHLLLNSQRELAAFLPSAP